MCGRVTIPGSDVIVEELGVQYTADPRPPQINVPPGGMQIPIITDSKSSQLQYFRWPLTPMWSKELNVKFSTSNATIENLKSSATWRNLIGKRHCTVITSGFYEWQYEDPIKKKGSRPHIIKTKGKKLTLMAGLWDAWLDKSTGEYIPSCTIITVPANELMADIHNTKGRMPAFLTEETSMLWNDKELPLIEREQALLPVGSDFLIAHPVKSVTDEDEVYGKLELC